MASAMLVCCVVCGPASARKRRPPDRQIRTWIAKLRDGPAGARNQAAQQLYYLRDGRGDAAVIELARAADAGRRAIGVWALAIVRPRGAKTIIVRRLSDVDAGVRRAAVRALGTLRQVSARSLVRRRLLDKDRGVRAAAVWALSRFGKWAPSELARATRARTADVRLLAVAALGASSHPLARRRLYRICRRGSRQLRLEAARQLLRRSAQPALSAHGRRVVGATLARLLLQKRYKGTRLQAARLLARDTSTVGKVALRRALRSGDDQVRRAASSALSIRKNK